MSLYRTKLFCLVRGSRCECWKTLVLKPLKNGQFTINTRKNKRYTNSQVFGSVGELPVGGSSAGNSKIHKDSAPSIFGGTEYCAMVASPKKSFRACRLKKLLKSVMRSLSDVEAVEESVAWSETIAKTFSYVASLLKFCNPCTLKVEEFAEGLE